MKKGGGVAYYEDHICRPANGQDNTIYNDTTLTSNCVVMEFRETKRKRKNCVNVADGGIPRILHGQEKYRCML